MSVFHVWVQSINGDNQLYVISHNQMIISNSNKNCLNGCSNLAVHCYTFMNCLLLIYFISHIGVCNNPESPPPKKIKFDIL